MSLMRIIGGGAAALAAAALASGAAAQSATGIKLPAVTVEGQAGGSLTVPGVDQQREILDETVGSVGFVDSESYKGRYSNTLREVLDNSPGVYVQNRYGQEMRISIRGSGIARGFHLRGLELLQDGIPLNLADGSGDLYQIDPLALRSAEIYKGGNGLAYGSSTLGGAINFVTPTAYTAIAPNVLRLEGGSFDTFRGNAQLSRKVGDLDFLVNLTGTYSDGYRNHSDQRSTQNNVNIGYRFNPSVETRFYGGLYIVKQKLPGSLTLSQALNTPTMATPAVLAGDQARNTTVQRIANRTSFRLDVGQLDVDSWAIHKKLFHPIFQVISQDGWTYGFGPRYSATMSIGGFTNELLVGGRIFAGNNDARQFVNVNGHSGTQTVNANQKATNYEAYAENRFWVNSSVALMLGAKAFSSDRDYTDYWRPQNSASKTYNGVNPKVGVLWQPKSDIQVFADVTRSQDVPDFSDLVQTQVNGATGFVPLDAQKAVTFEVGSRGSYGRFGWDATVFRSQIDGQMLQYTTSPNSIPAATFNAGRTVNQGFELGLKADVVRDILGKGDGISVYQLWNYNNFRFKNDPQYGNNKIAGLPTNVLRTAVTYSRPDGFYLTPTLDWVPQGAYADYANTLRSPGYALLGLQTGMQFQNGVLVYLDARNLTDERYVSDVGTITNAQKVSTSIFYPGDGRSVFAGVRVAF